MAERPNRDLIDEVRRRAAARRARRNRRTFWITLASLAAVLAVVIPLGVFSGGGQRVRVEGPAAPGTTPPAATTPSTTPVAPGTTILPPRPPTGQAVGPDVAGSAPTTPAPATTVGPGLPPPPAQLKVVVCPTTFGITPPPAPVSLPATMTVQISPSQPSQVAVYTDNQGRMMLLAPAGWTCSANYGADGSGGVVVAPSGEAVPSNWGAGWSLPPGSPTQAVAGFETSACEGCTLAQACPLFAAAASAFQSQFAKPCPLTKPASEIVYHYAAGPGVLGFQDPAGTRGDGLPSGGADPANGVVTYNPAATDGSWRETCTLPADENAICATTLDDFVARYGTR